MKSYIKSLILLLTIFLLGLQPLALQPAYAAQVACQTRYVVKSGDTLGTIMKRFPGTTAWDLISANNRYVRTPNYPIYAGWAMCIPRDKGNKRAVSRAIIDQPAAETVILRLGNKYTIYAWGWRKGSIWTVKINNDRKVGRLIVTTKNRVALTLTINTRPTKFCFKDQVYDALLCFPAPK